MPFDINALLGVHFTYDKVIATGAVELGADQPEGFPITFDPTNLANDFFRDGGQVKTVDASAARAGYTANGKYYLPVFGSFTLDEPNSQVTFYIVGFSDDALLTVRNDPKVSVNDQGTTGRNLEQGVEIFFSGQQDATAPITFTNDPAPYTAPPPPPANPFDISLLNGISLPDQPIAFSNTSIPNIDTDGVIQPANGFAVNGPTNPAYASGVGTITVRDSIYRPGYTNSYGQYVLPSFGRIDIAQLPYDYGGPVPGVLNPYNTAPSGTFYVHGFGDDGASLFLTQSKDALGGSAPTGGTVIIDLDGFNGPVTFTNAPANIDNVETAVGAVAPEPSQPFDINSLLGVHFDYTESVLLGSNPPLQPGQANGLPITFTSLPDSTTIALTGKVISVDATYTPAQPGPNGSTFLPTFGSFVLDQNPSNIFYIVGFTDNAILTSLRPQVTVTDMTGVSSIQNSGATIFFTGPENLTDPITFTSDSTSYVAPDVPANPFDINVLNGVSFVDQGVAASAQEGFIVVDGIVQGRDTFSISGIYNQDYVSGIGTITVLDSSYRPGYFRPDNNGNQGRYVPPSFGKISIAAIPPDTPGAVTNPYVDPVGVFYIQGFGDDGASLLITQDRAVTFENATGFNNSFIIDLDGFSGAATFGSEPADIDAFEAAVCFAEGTMIETPAGPVAVEDLVEGGEVLTASGAVRPIRWIGAMTARPAYHPRPNEVNPVRVKAGAFGERLPRRDVRLSPGHAVFVDGVLVPVGQLVNGATIVQEEVARIRYFHVELDTHDVLLAEGLPCESYLDDGNRATFANADAVTDLHGRLDPKSWDDACAPMVAAGPQLGEVRQRLHDRAEALGWVRSDAADLRIEADGVEIAPLHVAGLRFWFAVPAAAALTLRSTAAVLAHVVPGLADRRMLGVAVSEVRVDGAAIGLDDAAFGAGFHAIERNGETAWRWTNGAAAFVGTGDAAVIDVTLAIVAPTWTRPVPQLRAVA